MCTIYCVRHVSKTKGCVSLSKNPKIEIISINIFVASSSKAFLYKYFILEEDPGDMSFSLSMFLGSRQERMEHLLHCLTDTFENNKIEAYSVLEALPFFSLKLELADHLRKTFMVGRI